MAAKPTFEEWLIKHNFKPFVTDDGTFDVDFVDSLMASLLGGYDKDHPVIRADSDKSEIKGEVVDGRHRLYVCYLAEVRKNIKIKYAVIDEWIGDEDELDIRQAYYDKLSESKERKASQKRQEKNFDRVIARHPELMDSQETLVTFFAEKGWHDHLTLDFWIRKRVEKRAKSESAGGENHELPVETKKDDADVSKNWETPEDGSTGKRFDCECCGTVYEHFIKDNSIVATKVLKKGEVQQH